MGRSFPMPAPFEVVHASDASGGLYALQSEESIDFVMLEFDDIESAAVVLRRLKVESSHAHIPVVVVGEDDPSLARQMYQLRANAYVRRPKTPGERERFVSALWDFWGETVQLHQSQLHFAE